MNKCQNPECNKEISDEKKYCGEQCLKRHFEIKKEAKFETVCPESAKILKENEKVTANVTGIGKNNEITVNKGTDAKALLQEQALRCMQKYDRNQTAKEYACLLCWDIHVSQRTALEGYIEPMIKHKILILSSGNRYRLSPEYEASEDVNLPTDKPTDEPKETATEYIQRKKEA